MIVKLGDLLCLKKRIGRSSPQDIWLVIGWSGFSDYITVQNVSTGERCQYNMTILKHLKTDKK